LLKWFIDLKNSSLDTVLSVSGRPFGGPFLY